MENLLPEEPSAQPVIQISAEEASQIQSAFMRQVYGWMAAALALTGGVALLVSGTPEIVELVVGNRLVFFALLLLEMFVVGYISARAFDMESGTVTRAFLAYSVLNGITLSIIFLVFTADSIASTFFVSAATFGVMSLYGYFTRTNLARWGNILMMGVVGLIIASVVNLFWLNSLLYTITSFVGVVLFVALTAYDTQKMKALAFVGIHDDETDRKAAVLGALTLYLDFVNLFLFLLRIFGRRR
ncbi:Bax inhibitor-1/YccA family protein [Hymenobacter rigui]|uniref:Bax inhibitor-1/YccA family protein n=1 Tax=Hymenobacter rigui TaxID=334424 RepID=A0A3R9P1P7_9BACT|nr:Bax inhibitor-1/YccA family protein [Hymenobacter rigui]RSK48247.1 Bax inhibitor-1/YccA family protein [Hymenobacter rigui]